MKPPHIVASTRTTRKEPTERRMRRASSHATIGSSATARNAATTKSRNHLQRRSQIHASAITASSRKNVANVTSTRRLVESVTWSPLGYARCVLEDEVPDRLVPYHLEEVRTGVAGVA